MACCWHESAGTPARSADDIWDERREVAMDKARPGDETLLLRVSGQLVEIGESDLRFTVDETAALLLAVTDRTVARDDVEILTGRRPGGVL